MSIAIYGAGSIGTVLGAYLTRAGYEVDLINRNLSHIEGLKQHGATITGTVAMQVPVTALLPEEMHRKYDIIFLLTKQLDNRRVVRFLQEYLQEEGVICTAQNGLPELSVAEVVGEEKTFGCAVAWGATLLGEGVCELTSQPDSLTFSIGTLGTDEGKLAEIKTLLETMGEVSVEQNFIGARWSKLLINAAFSGMSGVLGCTFGEAARNRQSRRCLQRIMKECIDVAEAAGITIEPIQGKDIRKLLDYRSRIKQLFSFHLIPLLIRKHAKLKASLLQDLEKGRLTEIDAINGIVSRYGKKYGVATPFNDRVVEIIHGIENGDYSPDLDNITLFENLLMA